MRWLYEGTISGCLPLGYFGSQCFGQEYPEWSMGWEDQNWVLILYGSTNFLKFYNLYFADPAPTLCPAPTHTDWSWGVLSWPVFSPVVRPVILALVQVCKDKQNAPMRRFGVLSLVILFVSRKNSQAASIVLRFELKIIFYFFPVFPIFLLTRAGKRLKKALPSFCF